LRERATSRVRGRILGLSAGGCGRLNPIVRVSTKPSAVQDILTTYQELGSYRAAAALCGTTHKTVRRVVERRGRAQAERAARPRVTEPVLELIAAKVKSTDGRISAKRLLPLCRAEGYTGSARSLRRAVASAKTTHRRGRRAYRPWQPVPGEHLVFDWGTEDGMQVFCAVLAWSRWRFVRFAQRQDQATTLRLLAECFELLGGVPGVLLTDRMGCLKGGVVADVMVPAPGYVAFAAHYGFRPDFCEAGDPESKGVVEALVGYAKSDLLVGLGPFAELGDANTAAVSWCAEVNGRPHSETMAVPDERLLVERTLLGALSRWARPRAPGTSWPRGGSIQFSVPIRLQPAMDGGWP
jgi:transposase